MYRIQPHIHYVGVNDRQKALFENLWPLPHGVSYNSYLIDDEKTALVDAVDVCYVNTFLDRIDSVLQGRPLDYLIVNHMEPDHSGAMQRLQDRYPDMTIVATARAFEMMQGFYSEGIGAKRIVAKEGATLALGAHTLTFYMAPMVHWPEVMMTYESSTQTLFSADAFGTFGTLDGGVLDGVIDTRLHRDEMYRYYSNIVGKYGSPVQKALKKLSALTIRTIASTHGPVWQERIEEVVGIYDRLSRYEGQEGVVIVYGTMYGHTAEMAEAIAQGCVEAGVSTVRIYSASTTPASYLLSEIFRYKGLAIGSPTYSNTLFPEIEALLSKLRLREVRHRKVALFGSCSWAAAAGKQLFVFAEEMGFELIAAPIEIKHKMTAEQRCACVEAGHKLGQAVLER